MEQNISEVERMDELEMYAPDERWSIKDDSSADWAIGKVKEAFAERDRIVRLCEDKIAFYKEQEKKAVDKAAQNTDYLLHLLTEYFGTVKAKETKTQRKYELIEGSLVMTKPKAEIKRNDEVFTAWCKANNHTEFIRTEEKLEWGNLKKNLMVDAENGIVVTKDGELVEGAEVEIVPEKFDIKFKETAV